MAANFEVIKAQLLEELTKRLFFFPEREEEEEIGKLRKYRQVNSTVIEVSLLFWAANANKAAAIPDRNRRQVKHL